MVANPYLKHVKDPSVLNKPIDGNLLIKSSPIVSGAIPKPNESDIVLEDLIDKAMVILSREITNLLVASSSKKLDTASARDLAVYVKLLTDMKLKQDKTISSLSDEEILDEIEQQTITLGTIKEED